MTSFRTFLIGLVVLFAAFVAVEYYRPEPTNWQPTYQNRDKIPFGTYVLYDLLPDLFGRQAVSTVRQPIANQLLPNLGTQEFANQDTVLPATAPSARVLRTAANYVFVHHTFTISRLDRDALLRYVARGNHAFIATEYLDELLADTLRLHLASGELGLKRRARRRPATERTAADSTTLHLLNPAFAAHARFRFPSSEASWFFEPDSACRAIVLATNAKRQPVLVRVPYGRGALVLSSTPAALSNYFLLRPATAGFGFAALSYLPQRPVFWDEYQKQGPLGEQSLWRVVSQHAALRWAVGLAAVGLALFALFEAKRRQRVIPVLKPLPNTTLLFTRTVASLYRQNDNHALMAEKKISLFLELLRQRLQEPALDLNSEATRKRLTQLSGFSRTQVDELIRVIHYVRTAPQVRDAELQKLNAVLSSFRKAAFS
ncbi:DUF4350 domain-containing protein [Hymenobacter persicinus]|uniref:DUF4350 domain-containing protein n=1 Tax=Hymenobacter persicinus TaxID=2025506 RepID=A0A4Q5LAQ8_9BACT|nr:DUF4350 domain-containing protein [Hymenobacter persicinus]RYU78004.1 DUF4350 domain-containing protein [Hymenobacter persicinus]